MQKEISEKIPVVEIQKGLERYGSFSKAAINKLLTEYGGFHRDIQDKQSYRNNNNDITDFILKENHLAILREIEHNFQIRKERKKLGLSNNNHKKRLLNENLNVHNGREDALDNRNSDGQEVQEPGEYSTNVYLKDCPFLLGKENVEFFKLVQAAKERHTITSPEDFIKSAKMNESARPLNEEMDLSGIGEVQYSIDFDDDFYEEWLNDEELTDTPENKERYAKEECSFEIEYLDNDTFHSCGFDTFSYDQLIDEFGERIGERMFRECMEDGKGSFETCCIYDDEKFDVNDSNALNKRAKQILKHGHYYKDCRGYILTDGTVVYTPAEHNMASQIDGVKGTYHFISLGNIRLLQHSIDIGKMPTEEQFNTLRVVVSKNSREPLYVDLMGQKQELIGKSYEYPIFEKIKKDIIEYFSKEMNESVGIGVENTGTADLLKNADVSGKVFWDIVFSACPEIIATGHLAKSKIPSDKEGSRLYIYGSHSPFEKMPYISCAKFGEEQYILRTIDKDLETGDYFFNFLPDSFDNGSCILRKWEDIQPKLQGKIIRRFKRYKIVKNALKKINESVENNIQNVSDVDLTHQADFRIKWRAEMDNVIKGIEKETPKADFNCIDISQEKFYDCGLDIKGDTYFPDQVYYNEDDVVYVSWSCAPEYHENETGVYMPDMLYEELPWWENPESLREQIKEMLGVE